MRMHPALYLMGHKSWYGTEQTPARFTPPNSIFQKQASVFLFFLFTSLESN